MRQFMIIFDKQHFIWSYYSLKNIPEIVHTFTTLTAIMSRSDLLVTSYVSSAMRFGIWYNKCNE